MDVNLPLHLRWTFFFLFSSEKEGIKAEFKGRKCLSVKPMLKQTWVYNLLFYFQTTTSQKTIFHLFVVSVFLHFTVIFRGFIHSLGVVNCPVTRLYVGQKYLIPFTFYSFFMPLCQFLLHVEHSITLYYGGSYCRYNIYTFTYIFTLFPYPPHISQSSKLSYWY